MVTSSKTSFEIPHATLLILRRLSAALISFFVLRVCMWVYDEPMREPYQALMIISFLLAMILIPDRPRNEFETRNRLSNSMISVAIRWGLVVAILLLLGYGTKTSSIFSRRLLFTWVMFTPPLIVLTRLIIDAVIERTVLSADNAKSVVIAGANAVGQTLAKKLASPRHGSMRFEGFFDDRSSERLSDDPGLRIIGGLQDLPVFLQTNAIDVIFIALPMRNIQRVSELLDQLHDTTASIYFVPDVYVFDLIQCRTDLIDGVPVIALCETPFHGTQAIVKRISDYVIASMVLLLTGPLLLLIAAGIKLTSRGDVIFKQRRYGLDGKEITVYKFRSMSVTEDSGEIRQATRNDARITRLGAFLRRYSLDELPQFINVLQGRMSVVGPRPHAIAHNEQYRGLIKGYMVRHKVYPGITGLAQVHGCRGETRSIEDMERRIEYDLRYLRDWSFMLDIQIIAKTVALMFRDDMAY
ncbi:MAG TPA: undecaprenyl-phosphate glucose phosphotransferase [Woeseiaceae bacterium]|nr:undecaprenyl-phosphate glucose phosphotransferase [Woeseiaceae bacterium]